LANSLLFNFVPVTEKAPFDFRRMTPEPIESYHSLAVFYAWKIFTQCVCLICNPSSTNQNLHEKTQCVASFPARNWNLPSTLLLLLALAATSGICLAQANYIRSVRLDDQGVVRWTDDNSEVRLLGTNYSPMSAHDYMTVGFYAKNTEDRHKAIDQDLAHFARMGWHIIRLAAWGDWESSDEQDNLIQNDHVDLMDYLITKGRERGIYFLLTPMHTYRPSIPKEQTDKLRGFEHFYKKDELRTNPKAIAAQVNFFQQTMNHINP
jgi:hypothetical protein